MAYFINGKDLSDFGISVQKFSGWEVAPDENGDIIFDNEGFNGVEYLQNEIKEPKTLTLECTLIGADIVEVDTFFNDLQDWLYTPGVLVLSVDYLAQTFNTFFVDGITSKKITRKAYKFDLNLRQYDIN